MQRARPESPPDDIVLTVPGMACRHCVRAVSIHVRDVDGVVAVEADLEARTVCVQGTAPLHALVSAVADAGYEAVEWVGPVSAAAPDDGMRRPSE